MLFFLLELWLFMFLSLISVPILALNYPRFFRRIVKFLLWKIQLKCEVENARLSMDPEAPFTFVVELENWVIANPRGYSAEYLARIGNFKLPISPWPPRKYVTLGTLQLSDVTINMEKDKEKGLNVRVVKRKILIASLHANKNLWEDLTSHGDDEADDDPLLEHCLLGLASIKTEADNMSEEAKGHLSDSERRNRNGEMEDISDSFFGALCDESNCGSPVTDEAITPGHRSSVSSSVSRFSLPNSLKSRLSGHGGESPGNTLSEKKKYGILQKMLHKKMMKCYPEKKKEMFVNLQGILVRNLHINASGMLNELYGKKADWGRLFVEEVELTTADLIPHPKAIRQQCLPLPEVLRRLKLKTSYQIQKKNRSAIRGFIQENVKEKVIPAWVRQKKHRLSETFNAKTTAVKGKGQAVRAKASHLKAAMCSKAHNVKAAAKARLRRGSLESAGELLRITGPEDIGALDSLTALHSCSDSDEIQREDVSYHVASRGVTCDESLPSRSPEYVTPEEFDEAAAEGARKASDEDKDKFQGKDKPEKEKQAKSTLRQKAQNLGKAAKSHMPRRRASTHDSATHGGEMGRQGQGDIASLFSACEMDEGYQAAVTMRKPTHLTVAVDSAPDSPQLRRSRSNDIGPGDVRAIVVKRKSISARLKEAAVRRFSSPKAKPPKAIEAPKREKEKERASWPRVVREEVKEAKPLEAVKIKDKGKSWSLSKLSFRKKSTNDENSAKERNGPVGSMVV